VRRNFELFSSELQKCGLLVGLMKMKNPQEVQNE
jgi:hypothetical protein